jgi:hypothetical protein
MVGEMVFYGFLVKKHKAFLKQGAIKILRGVF